MSLPGFHPLVSRWFTETLGEPTPAQQRGWAAIRQRQHTLIAAPTGSGKTLAAFLSAINDLVEESQHGPLPEELRVVYVSPLKALSVDIHKNLAEPRRQMRQLAEQLAMAAPHMTAAVRTGDTTQAERAAILRTPPHILVTTPESLYLLLTSERSREMLRTARTVIVDEIHAVIGTRRGAHLALSLERLEHLANAPLQRIGLSATQKPIDEVARFLVGNRDDRCTIVDEGHCRQLDLALEIPRSPLEAVMAHEVWEEYYERLAQLIAAHKTTLVFVNTRRLAERVARSLSDRLGEEAVTAHHGSLSKETRLDAEHRLKAGGLKALVATASLELGIDIGHVDLVCQIGSPHRIATLLQRVGRSGHTIHGTPKGRLMPLSRDDLVECAALLRAARSGELDAVLAQEAPLDVLAQQITAEVSCREWTAPDLFTVVRRAWPYRALERAGFDAVVRMVSEGFATRRGRRGALVHRDEVHDVLRGRRGSQLLALTSGGAIPEVADYRVVLEPNDVFVGTVNEDFALESMAGDIFQLGNASWQIRQVVAGTVRVTDAHGAPPTIPFWLGEAPARSDELSRAVSDLRAEADTRVRDGTLPAWLETDAGLSKDAAAQLASYLMDGHRSLGAIPTQQTLVLERFFDESGGMQLVLHAPFGSRVNKAWALALRKRFCRQFNFELQAAATEDALLLSLGPQHSFPLADVFRYLHPASVREILVQALLDAPMFQTRWRWNATISLAVPRQRGSRRLPPQLQRMQANDLLTAAFPDATACAENLPGDREIPDHPLVRQTIDDCLRDAMNVEHLTSILSAIHDGSVHCLSRDTPEPSAFAHEILNARPYAYLDDAPLEERRARAVQMRRSSESADDHLGVLDRSAIDRVREEERPDPRDANELHDALVTCGFLVNDEIQPETAPERTAPWMDALTAHGRATRVEGAWSTPLYVSAERLPELLALYPNATLHPAIAAPASRQTTRWSRPDALVELLRSRLSFQGPTSIELLAGCWNVNTQDIESALVALESDGAVLRGHFTPGAPALEWCDRRLLARIHRYTLNRLRSEIAPCTVADFVRFLCDWQHITRASRLSGPDGLRAIVATLDGVEAPARAWERDILPARLDRYEPAMLDLLCLTGVVGWARLSTGTTQVAGTSPIALFLREHADAWLTLSRPIEDRPPPDADEAPELASSDAARRVLAQLRAHGASFASVVESQCRFASAEFLAAAGELVSAGLISSDGFTGLRAVLTARSNRETPRRLATESTGRWFALGTGAVASRDAALDAWARALLRRYGVVFRRLAAVEPGMAAWRDLVRVYRRLEARGEIRGGHFVSGVSGEQFALPDAVDRLREVRRTPPTHELVTVSAADPLNLTGVLGGGERIRTVRGNRVVYRDGIAVAAMEGDMLRTLAPLDAASAAEAAAAAAGRRVPVLAGYVGRH